MLRSRRLMLASAAMGSWSEINHTLAAGAIVPTLGAEMLINGGFEDWASATNADGWVESVTAPSTIDREGTIVHAGTYACKFAVNTSGLLRVQQSVTVPAGTWLYWSGQYRGPGGKGITNAVGALSLQFDPNAGAYAEQLMTGRLAAENPTLTITRFDGGTYDIYIDALSVKAITFSTALALLGDIKRSTGTFACAPTVTSGAQAGIALNYADADNLVLAYVNRLDGKAYLDKRIGGTWSNVINGAITYVAGQSLQVVVSGANYSLYYNSAQIGSTTAINDAGLGTRVYGFATDSGSTPGTVTTNP